MPPDDSGTYNWNIFANVFSLMNIVEEVVFHPGIQFFYGRL